MEDNIEKLIKEALSRNIDIPPEDSPCLEESVFEKLCNHTIGDDERLLAIEHLDQCEKCRADLAFYMELINPKTQMASIYSRLQDLKSILSKVSERIDLSDFKMMCHRVIDISMQIIQNKPLDQIETLLNEMFLKIHAEMAFIKTPFRGDSTDKQPDQLGYEQLIDEAALIKDIAQRRLDEVQSFNYNKEENWAGLPEAWLLRRLPESLRIRAMSIRDRCEERLEAIGYLTRQNRLPLLGIAHAKRMLANAVSILKAYEDYFCDPLTYFVVYVACYGRDLGFRIDEKTANVLDFYRTRHLGLPTHFIEKNIQEGVFNWQKLGFLTVQEASLTAGICAGGVKDVHGLTVPLPKAQTIFWEGQSQTVSARALAVLIGLSDQLDLRESRVSYLAGQNIMSDDVAWIEEYIQHEATERVEIHPDGKILITLKVRYQYPETYSVSIQHLGNSIKRRIDEYRLTLKECGIVLPEPEIVICRPLFTQKHPYLNRND